MTTQYTREQIVEGLITDVAECLSIEPVEIQPESQIFSAGDSLEILDITFRIQKRFGIRVHLQNLLEGWQVDPDGKISPSTIEKLKCEFPEIDWSSRLARIQGDDPFELLTVGLLAQMVFQNQKGDLRSVSTSSAATSSPMVSSVVHESPSE